MQEIYNAEELLAFYDFPAEHWIHLRTTNPIEWRAITGAHLVPLVRAGARFENGVLAERQEQAA